MHARLRAERVLAGAPHHGPHRGRAHACAHEQGRRTMAIGSCGTIGMYTATASPGRTPRALSQPAMRHTSRSTCAYVHTALSPAQRARRRSAPL